MVLIKKGNKNRKRSLFEFFSMVKILLLQWAQRNAHQKTMNYFFKKALRASIGKSVIRISRV